jgi:hypothetical protein
MDFYWLLAKNISVMFLNSPHREKSKHVLKQNPRAKGKEGRMAGGRVWDLALVRGAHRHFFAGPSGLARSSSPYIYFHFVFIFIQP